MTTTQRESRDKRILAHGLQLLAIFPQAREQDPVRLCKRLRALERKGAAVALRLCNGPEFEGGYEQVDKITDAILAKVNHLLGNTPDAWGWAPAIFVNRDPRGYALKIREADTAKLRERGLCIESDWGGYGILAPEIK